MVWWNCSKWDTCYGRQPVPSWLAPGGKLPRGQRNLGHRIGAPLMAVIFPTVNEVQFHTAFHYHPAISSDVTEIMLKRTVKSQVIHPPIIKNVYSIRVAPLHWPWTYIFYFISDENGTNTALRYHLSLISNNKTCLWWTSQCLLWYIH